MIPLGGAGSLTPRADWSYQSSFYSAAINSQYNHVPGYNLVNARLTWQSSDDLWSVSGELTNATNEVYYYSFFDNQGSSQNTLAAIAPPRQWAITLKRSFQ